MVNFLYNYYSDSVKLPRLIQIDRQLIAISFTLMKLLPAKYLIEKALSEGRIKKGEKVVETSSGTYAMGLAIVCAEKGLPFHIVSDPVIDDDLKRQLEHLGGEVEIVEDSQNGHQVGRLKALKKHLEKHPGSFWPQQYDNPDHLVAYSALADFLIKNLGDDFILIASVGSGSSSCGTIIQLRKYNPKISLIGVDTFGSILFGLDNNTRTLRGLGNSIMPKNLIHSLFDEVHWLNASQAFGSTTEFYSKTAIFAGPTTGACYQVAKWVADKFPEKKIAFISADSGHRYSSNVYNDDWINANNYRKKTAQPIQIQTLSQANNISNEWAYINWKRRTLEQVKND